MEPYVAEEVAREMLAKDAALKVRFEEKLRDDPEFAASPRARLDFFYRLHPSWDERFNLYPVLRTAVVPGGRCHCVGGLCATIALPRRRVTTGSPMHAIAFPSLMRLLVLASAFALAPSPSVPQPEELPVGKTVVR